MTQGFVGTHHAAKRLGKSERWIRVMCESGEFKTARRPGKQKGGWWEIALDEITARLTQRNLNQKYG